MNFYTTQMRSGPAAAAALMLAAALFSGGCGDEQSVAAEAIEEATPARQAPPAGRKAYAELRTGAADRSQARRCRRTLGEFLDALESLRNSVAVGVTYESYRAALDGVRSTYAAIEPDELPPLCLVQTGAPAEAALNAYIEAANEWGGCLTDASCDSAAIEPRLQRSWRRAGNSIP
jgi:hypothetical protein